ncbi:phosphate ABC transporter ATP-binding protein [Anabaena cylindrica FACHB-243]|uniref:Phosphate ABC transporter ATP-binding protein, PhoT family n=1 Tax=Anabaena cylindrica (strain ATCC 27899 / PCC 7122) TaxID=272123 RepID=K9ZN60_ANACC|nr:MULTISPECIES: phosphate ABC transporter ATP-binding protein [Anabaena]AFZ59745.1 phosphate ABC transporter ATP-binding protein, PhoT family [Anabaena cylindrica PCC 7122]MBD2417150.1 phosphate ABC transporter ATP-binding protein [Anabaena cylindrica FACHB-243]MBY5285173.1 phosphate ABC transporter ATP-binding protein [Anabaena sp. CCAP 1446/1C]MBY5307879.1 phosphate ABC transporter ATP-binding protein [Anabaena sp. CCAP 1446/1C]MCM2405034.1 phosphate ABC transporter ATP-binding protein [Ana
MSKIIPALSVQNFSCYYDAQKIIEDVSMDIPQNKIIAIMGPSGCGKSTFLKSLNRMSELEGEVRVEGKVEFFGQNIYGRRVNLTRLRRQISIIYARANLFPMSIYDNVAYGVKVIGWHPKVELDEIVELALKSANLWEEVKNKLYKSALELSFGQQQRLCIARALAVKPQILLIDELCAGLDPMSTIKIDELIECLRSELTIVFVSHNIQQIARLSDFTALFHYNENHVGQLLEFAPTKKLVSNISDYRSRNYVSARFR